MFFSQYLYVLSNFLLVDSSFILLVDLGKSLMDSMFINNLVSVPSREHRVCFL